MGAVEFTDLYLTPKGHRDRGPRDAFDRLVREARDYNGHREGYSGDIQTVSGYHLVSPMTLKRAKRLVEKYWAWEDNAASWSIYEQYGGAQKPRGKRLENPLGSFTVQKWEACVCVPIKASADTNMQRGYLFFGLAAC